MVETIDLIDEDDDDNDEEGMLFLASESLASASAPTPTSLSHRRATSSSTSTQNSTTATATATATANDPAVRALVERIRTLLRTTVGVCPSNHWLADCLTELHCQQNTPNEDTVLAAAVLDQILYHDLRNVVRSFSNDNSNNSNDASPSPQTQLRRAIRQSLTAESSFKATLSAEFRLLVQAEEFVDVSLNAEKRFSGEATTAIPLSINTSQNQRCLKIAFVDGYTAEGSCDADFDDTNTAVDTHTFIAMEVSPLLKTNNSTNAHYQQQTLQAGAKFLLQGPITLRHGVAGWHAGNAVFMGGHVATLVELHQQAMALARERVGHGVDPTVRALIGNQARQDDNVEAEDEGEHESGDVVAPQPIQHQHVHAPLPENNHHHSIITDMPPPAHREMQQRLLVSNSSSSPYASSAPSATTATNVSSWSAPSSTWTHQPESQSQTFITPSSTQLNPYRLQPPQPIIGQQQQSRTNPYTAGSTTNSNDSSSQSIALTTSNAYAHGHAFNSSSSSSDQNAASMIAANTVTASAPAAPISASLRPASMTPMATHTKATAPCYTVAAASTRAASSPPIHYPYLQLVDLLTRAVNDATLYRQIYGKLYAVPLHMVGNHLNFNIVKQKYVDGSIISSNSNKKKAEKHYEYVMDARFHGGINNVGGVEDIHNTITCRVASCIIAPYFELSAADMRKLNRSDRTRADHLVLEGGRALRQESLRLHLYEITLEQMPDEFFSSSATATTSLNGLQPILRLLRRTD